MKVSTSKNKIINYSLATSSILLIILIWTIISSSYQNEMIFPNINQILNAFINILKNTNNINAVLITLLRVLITVIVCFIISIFIVGLYILLPNSIHFFKPLIQIMRSTPLAVISIFIFILIGDKLGPFIITILMSLPITIEGLITSIDEINKDIIDELKTLKGSTIKKITNIYIPIILPFIIMTLIQTLGMSFKVMIMGEYICFTEGSIGFMILESLSIYKSENIIVIIGVLFIISIATEIIVRIIQAKINKTLLLK